MPRNIFRQARQSCKPTACGRSSESSHLLVTNRRPTGPWATTLVMTELAADQYFMREALRQAQKAYAAAEVPVGAVVVREGKIIARAHNQVDLLKDATAHAEMLALTQAEAAVGDWHLTDCDLYVTKEPCAMCAGAVVHTRIRRVIFGCARSEEHTS